MHPLVKKLVRHLKITELNHPVCETKQKQSNHFSNFPKVVDVKLVELAMRSQYTVTPEMMWPICQKVTAISIMASKENVIYRIQIQIELSLLGSTIKNG